ncbi:unnamed protein product [Effrenium voratum]|uniref:C2HC zinc finger plants domain-containing protein n=1 Tax=Effrenium voratum TaxID=2562239 RepID=A0AA36IID4_9DINO|nr:unnamed protein product [Effrenium voratum]CAJ1425559.1 unnamed protein product [Effrenium voratum]
MATSQMDFNIMAVEELLGGAFLRMDQGDPEGALSCALQALRISAGPDAAVWGARQSALEVCRAILQRGGILVDRGHEAVLKQALQDGSSVVCTRCGALVAWSRAEAHRSIWCSSLGNETECDSGRPGPDDMETD